MNQLLVYLLTVLCSGVLSTGWKPIPPPRGLMLKYRKDYPPIEHIHHKHFKHSISPSSNHHFKVEDIKNLEHSSHDEEESRLKPYHSHKIPHILDESFFQQEPIHPFKYEIHKPGLSLDESKIKHHSHSVPYRPKTGKVIFKDEPSPTPYLDELQFHPKKIKAVPEIKYIPRPANFEHSHFENDIGLSHHHIKPHYKEKQECSLYKVHFKQDLYFQYIQYKVHIPDLNEFTICMWTKFLNHTNDHPLFSYAVRHQPRAIYLWVSSTDRSSYYNMGVNGHTICRLNYPVRLNKWYHTCQSWNGRTGEWQVWVNGERIGRGFHNLLVGHVIPGDGLAISGQEQRQYGGGFLEGPGAPKGSGGFLGEITMLQFYKVALTAGKAYTDHRHHHSLYASTTPEPPPLPPDPEEPEGPRHPFLENGQIRPQLPVFELAESIKPTLSPQQIDTANFETPLIFGNSAFNSDIFHHLDNGPLNLQHIPIYHNGLGIQPEHSLFRRKDDKKDIYRDKRTGEKSEGNLGSNEKDKNKEEKVKKVKNVSKQAQVNIDKIKYEKKEEKSDDEYEYVEYEEDVPVSQRRRRDIEEVTFFPGDFVTVDENKTEIEEDIHRRGKMMVIRKVDQRRPTQPRRTTTTRIVRGEAKPPNYIRNKPTRRPPNREFKRKQANDNEEDSEHQSSKTSKRQVLIGDPNTGYSYIATGLINKDFGHLFDPKINYQLVSFPQQDHHKDDLHLHHHHHEEEEEQKEEEDEIGENAPSQPEPAQHEVRRVMGVCSGCVPDPFRKVAIISWRSTPKKLYSGALYLKANAECKRF